MWLTALARRVARIRYRLLLINVIVAAVPLVGISFAHMHEHQLLAELEADLVHQAQVIRAVVVGDPAGVQLAARAPLLVATARDTRSRIRLLDEHGEVRADSHADGAPEGVEQPAPRLLRSAVDARPPTIPEPVEVANRREVIVALGGHYGAATRMWDHEDRVYLFVALPIVVYGTAPPFGGADGRGQAPTVGAHVVGVVYITRSTHDVKVQLYRLRAWLARLLLATIVATALLSLLLATTIARPLGRLTRRAQRIAARQPAEPDRLAERRDEIGDVARAVAAMTDELERRARDARTLAADISHEFKTPLTGIRGAAELLLDGAADDPDARARFLAMIVDDTARLDRLVSRLLELARVEDDRGTALPVDVVALARASAARPWPVPVEVTAVGDGVASGRAAAIASAIDNLVANAAQHAAPATIVTIEITTQPRALRIAVANHGSPLSPAARDRVWDRFYSTRAELGGTGLGLAIVRSVALAHGGSYGVRCAAGITTFWLDVRR